MTRDQLITYARDTALYDEFLSYQAALEVKFHKRSTAEKANKAKAKVTRRAKVKAARKQRQRGK